jgi:hypothetical protein
MLDLKKYILTSRDFGNTQILKVICELKEEVAKEYSESGQSYEQSFLEIRQETFLREKVEQFAYYLANSFAYRKAMLEFGLEYVIYAIAELNYSPEQIVKDGHCGKFLEVSGQPGSVSDLYHLYPSLFCFRIGEDCSDVKITPKDEVGRIALQYVNECNCRPRKAVHLARLVDFINREQRKKE